jgi:hypothetical protein
MERTWAATDLNRQSRGGGNRGASVTWLHHTPDGPDVGTLMSVWLNSMCVARTQRKIPLEMESHQSWNGISPMHG